jgi:pilus assembly protein CpaC
MKLKTFLTLGILSTYCAAGSTPAPALPLKVDPLIQIGVEVVEVDENKTSDLGIEWLSQLKVNEMTVPALFQVGTFSRDAITATLHALMSEGAADMLANPKLVTRNGSTAQFLAGGEIPYSTAGSLGTTSVEFKPYGVRLRISPKLENENRINMDLEAEVSAPDEENSISVSGNTVPGILSRQISSQLTLEPGNTLTLAGLIQNQKQSTRQGIPILQSIPGLGYLFSHKTVTIRHTSIVIFVTPTLLDVGKKTALLPAAPEEDLAVALEKQSNENE